MADDSLSSFGSVCAHPLLNTDEHIHDRSCRVEKIGEGRLYISRDKSGEIELRLCAEKKVSIIFFSCRVGRRLRSTTNRSNKKQINLQHSLDCARVQ